MPRYDYRCEAGHKYEKQEPFGSPAEQPCQKCGRTARRVLVAPPLVFKTGGYYKSSGRDFASENAGPASSSPSSSSSAEAKQAPSKSSAKPKPAKPSRAAE